MTWRINSATRITVLIPSATNLRCFVDDDEWNARFLELDCGDDPRDSRADDDGAGPGLLFGFTRRRGGVIGRKREGHLQVRLHHRPVVSRYGFAHAYRH